MRGSKNGYHQAGGTNGHGPRKATRHKNTTEDIELLRAAGFEPRFDMPAETCKDDVPSPEAIMRKWPEAPGRAAFTGIAGELVQRIEPHYEGDSAALLLQLLASFGSIAGSGATAGDWLPEPHRANLFCVIAGESSFAGKGVGWAWVRKALRDMPRFWERKQCIRGLSSGEGLIAHLKKLGRDKRLMAVATEFSRILKVSERENNPLSEILRDLWDSGDASVPTRKDPLFVSGAHFALNGHITVVELRMCMTELAARNGWGNRVLWCCAKRSKELPRGGGEPDLSVPQGKLDPAIRFALQRRELTLTRSATELWDAQYHRLTTRPPNKYGALTSRAAPQVLRLALIYALLDRSTSIDGGHLRSALALWAYCDRSVLYLFGDEKELPSRQAEVLYDALCDAGDRGLSGTEISDLFERHLTKRELGLALGALAERGLAVESVGPPTGGRRGKKWYFCEKSEKSEISEI